MKKFNRHFTAGFLALSLAGLANAQDTSKTSASAPTTLLENDYVRVLEARSQPGEKSPMHSHPAHLVYAFNKGKGRITTDDGKTSEMNLKKGSVTWGEPVRHQVENIGTKEGHLLIVELKKDVGTKAPKGDDPVKLDPKGYKVLFENERVRVLEGRLQPGREIGLHAHPAAVLYPLSPIKVEFTGKDGTKHVVEEEAGKARWLEPVLHSHKQLGDKRNHLLLFELKK